MSCLCGRGGYGEEPQSQALGVYVSKKLFTIGAEKLVALDNFRSGHINNGLAIMEISQTSHRKFNITAYEDDRERFHADMNDLANYLESIGL